MTELEWVGFSCFDGILSGKVRAGLNQVVLAVSVGHRRVVPWKEVYRYITGEMPELIGLGIVDFVYTD